MFSPERLLQPVFWQLVPEEALHLPAGAGPRVQSELRGGKGGRRGLQACRVNVKVQHVLHPLTPSKVTTAVAPSAQHTHFNQTYVLQVYKLQLS